MSTKILEVFTDFNMRKGQIQYRFVKLFNRTFDFNLPENFQELNQLQLEVWAEIIWHKKLDWFKTDKDGKIRIEDEHEYVAHHIEFARILLMCPPHIWAYVGYEDIRNMLFTWKITAPFFEGVPELKQNPCGCFGQFIGPADLDIMNAWEFSHVDSQYLRYKQTTEDEDLNRFISYLYREADPDFDPMSPDSSGDPRERFNENTEPLRRPFFSEIPKRKKLLVLFWYESWRMEMPKYFKHIFSKPNQNAARSKPEGWLKIFLAAGDGAKHFHSIKNTNINILLSDIDRVMKNAKDLKAEIKSNQS